MVIAIIAILIALLLPAVQQAREAARRMQCKNNLKQIGLALHNYADVAGMFPPGAVWEGTDASTVARRPMYAWSMFIAPYIDQANVYNAVGVGIGYRGAPPANIMESSLGFALNDPARRPVLTKPVAVFRCPSDVGPANNNWYPFNQGTSDQVSLPTSNYVANNGAGRMWPTLGSIPAAGQQGNTNRWNNGMFGAVGWGPFYPVNPAGACRRIRDVTDGLSNTVVIGEKAWERAGVQYAAGLVWGQKGSHWWACTTISDYPVDYSSGNTTVGMMSAFASGEYVMNPPASRNYDCQHYARHAFSSTHTGGAQFLMGDGSVRFISENLDAADLNGTLPLANYRTYARILGVDDGNPVGEF
ncbi:hypothetical protein AYO47_06510 [Planctomyces sp. SCGC AG-212-M04]|nr:hypothetical protein AYO47_06510 [Planctomyces sp. SCGC AG-212-M04]